MTRQSISKILIIIFVIVILGIVGEYFYLSNTKSTVEVSRNGTSGGLVPSGNPSVDTNTNIPNNSALGNVPRLRKISTTPVAGAEVFSRRNGSSTESIIRFVDRATGNIYETSTSSLAVIRVTNTTIPKINEAYFNSDGNSVLLQFANESELE